MGQARDRAGYYSEWFVDVGAGRDILPCYRVKETLYEGESDTHSRIVVNDLAFFGKSLFLDGTIQNTSHDSLLYNEIMVHPAMLMHPCPRRVFVAGGAGGACVREVLRHSCVESVIQVEIDEVVARIMREHWHGSEADQNWLGDVRYDFRIGDALAFLKSYPVDSPKFDIIILDISDPMSGGPSFEMFTAEFYRHCLTLLGDDGVLSTHAQNASLKECRYLFCPIVRTFQSVFGVDGTLACVRFIPSFITTWGFVFGLKNPENGNRDGQGLDQSIHDRIEGGILETYDEESHRRAFMLEKFLRDALQAEEAVITMETPICLDLRPDDERRKEMD